MKQRLNDDFVPSIQGLMKILAPPAPRPTGPIPGPRQNYMTADQPLDNRSEGALSGLQAASHADPLLPDSELYRMANRDEGTVAPGANQYWGNVLKQRQTDEDAQTAIENARQAAISGATTSAQLGGMSTPQAMSGYARQQAEKESAAKQGLEGAQAELARGQAGLTTATADEYRQRGQGALLTGQANLYKAQHPNPVAGIGAAGSKTLQQLEATLANEMAPGPADDAMDALHKTFHMKTRAERIADLQQQIAAKKAELNIQPAGISVGATGLTGPDPIMVPEGEIYEDPSTGSIWTKVNGTLHQLDGGQ
jgi:hypothetical protein